MGNTNSKERIDYTSNDEVKRWFKQARVEFNERWDNPASTLSSFDRFDYLKTLGIGGFCFVMLAKRKSTEELFAVKVMEKAKLFRSHAIEHTMDEKRILACVRFPFVIKLTYHYKDMKNLYMAMDFVQGGDLWLHLRKRVRYSEPQARFYAGQIIMAVAYLHQMDIIHRDLKPENVMISSDGYLKLSDFGFAKRVQGRTYTLCGTTDYFAPEVILGKGYGKAVDWWAVGVLIFEMTVGYPPFSSNLPIKTCEKIVSGKIKYPATLSSDLKNLMHNLIQVDLSKRYGNLKNGIYDIRSHPWFATLNWIDLFNKTVEAPYIPKLNGADDTSSFDIFIEEPIDVGTYDEYPKQFADF